MDEQTIEPLPYNVPPPTPRPSFARNLQLSTYLFPDRNLRFSISSSSARSEEDKQLIERAHCNQKTDFDQSSLNTKYSQMTTVAQNKTKSKKVTFNKNVYAIAPKHIPTEDEKRRIWYNKGEYDGFKFNAAEEAGVRLLDFFPPAEKQPYPQDLNASPAYTHKFVMIGDFDKEDNSVPTDATIASSSKYGKNAKNAASYHVPTKCKNEYNDEINKEGNEICKRGLGYHFSRYRKRNRVWTRYSVLTWQKTLRSVKAEEDVARARDQVGALEPQQPLKLSQKCDLKLNLKSQRLLAIVSAKCSRSSRQAALWRGMMDYEMAHTENRKVSFDLGSDDFACNNKRSATSYDSQERRKRQRCEKGNANDAYSYLAGVFAV